MRRFREHDLRTVYDLRGIWDFAFLDDVDPDTLEIGSITYADRMAVPGCFDATPAYAGKRGLAAYRTQVPVLSGQHYRLILDGVHHWGRVFVQGNHVRDHIGGFTRFAADFTAARSGQAEIVVLADNRFDAERCPLHQEYFDWYHYGGLARGAEVHRLGTVWIDSLTLSTLELDPPRIRVALVYGAEADVAGAELRLEVDGRWIHAERLDLAMGGGRIERELELPGAALWSPDSPALHMLRAQVPGDDLYERFGIRQVGVEGREIQINGRPVRLLGFNRHESHPQFGHGLPDAVLVQDAQWLREMGCNFVRGSHYPQDARFLDLCDETGLCVWNEAIGWQHTAEHLRDPRFVAAQLTNIDEMVAMAVNHPSVILWGILNESHSHDPTCRAAYATLLGRLRALDGTRPVTYASNHPFADVCLDLVDVVSINCYPGWYGGDIASIPAAIDEIVAYLDGHGQAEKPLIISEIGAGAIPGWRDWNGTRWSEQYQAELLEAVIRHLYVERERVCGLAIWQYCDVRTSEAVHRILGRPRGFNNKGIVDEYRRPKLAFEVVKRLYRELNHDNGRKE